MALDSGFPSCAPLARTKRRNNREGPVAREKEGKGGGGGGGGGYTRGRKPMEAPSSDHCTPSALPHWIVAKRQIPSGPMQK